MSTSKQGVSRTINATAEELFGVLAQPDRHAELDGSGMVVSNYVGTRLTAVGQKFTMNMHSEHLGGDYQTDNYVTNSSPTVVSVGSPLMPAPSLLVGPGYGSSSPAHRVPPR